MRRDLQRPDAEKATTGGMLESSSSETVAGSDLCLFAGSIGKGATFLIGDSCESVSSGTLASALFALSKLKCAGKVASNASSSPQSSLHFLNLVWILGIVILFNEKLDIFYRFFSARQLQGPTAT